MYRLSRTSILGTTVGLTILTVGCNGPLNVKALPGQEAELAAEGQYDERQQDDTAGAQDTDSLTADGYRGLRGDPFVQGVQNQDEGLNEDSAAPDAAAILVPGLESENGGIPADPGGQGPPQ
jgi:hypothetical protein